MEHVTARRRAEVAAVVERPAPRQRAASVEALTAFSVAGGEPLAPSPDDSEPHPPVRAADVTAPPGA
ncbi:hypothetical protein [Streptomyces flaveolus]|uniref:hypothetical protein n=1 Tax=Streptomyces flaveolus TaxID=67297 RepID=UPI00379A0138